MLGVADLREIVCVTGSTTPVGQVFSVGVVVKFAFGDQIRVIVSDTENLGVIREVIQFGEHLAALVNCCAIVAIENTGRQFMKCVIKSPHQQIEQSAPSGRIVGVVFERGQ